MAKTIKLLIDGLLDPERVAEPWLREDGKARYEVFSWPPDCFAIAATVLRDSGAYLQTVRPHDYPDGCSYCLPSWPQHVEAISAEWRSLDYTSQEPPEAVRKLLDQIAEICSDTPLSELSRPDRRNLTWLPFVELMCIADHACRGVGLLFPVAAAVSGDIARDTAAVRRLSSYPGDSIVCRHAMLRLHEQLTAIDDTRASSGFSPLTLCVNILKERAVVLPKMRTSQRGVTIRSLSLHLALLNGTDVEPIWSPSSYAILEAHNRGRSPILSETPAEVQHSVTTIAEEAGPYNIILLPWPEQIRPTQFSPAKATFDCLGGRPCGKDGFFKFQHDEMKTAEFLVRVKKLVLDAQQLVGTVHGIILPEMAMTRSDFDKCFSKPLEDVHFVACGVYEPPTGEDCLARNYAIIQRWVQRTGQNRTIEQKEQEKHHRWALDSNQLATYSLGSSLRLDRTWWEGIDIPRRRLCFFGLDAFTAFTVLVCEDLARPDPVGDAVRAVGPNLVICLLMDGPQLSTRWSSRYSTVLADDPGSSTLTLSSLGMVLLSRTRDRLHEPSRVIAMWREPGGAPVELTLPVGDNALLLSLSVDRRREYTVDGRHDNGMASALRLAGVHGLRWGSSV